MSIEIGGVEVFSLEEVSKTLGVEPEALKRLMRRGELVARKIGDHWFVTSQNLLAFLQRDKDKTAFADADRCRLRLGFNRATGEGKDERYKAALARLPWKTAPDMSDHQSWINWDL
jgi:hypothetical protein